MFNALNICTYYYGELWLYYNTEKHSITSLKDIDVSINIKFSDGKRVVVESFRLSEATYSNCMNFTP